VYQKQEKSKESSPRDDKGKGNGSLRVVTEPVHLSNLVWTGLIKRGPFAGAVELDKSQILSNFEH
jgi:hypothetical protein